MNLSAGIATQLCQNARDWDGDNHCPSGGIVEPKIDGWRALHFRGRDGNPGLWTKNGHPIEGAGHILHFTKWMEQVAGYPLFIDGEFQVDGCLSATKAYCERGWRLGLEQGTFFIFDCLPDDQWRRGGTNMPLIERKAVMKSIFERARDHKLRSWEWREGTHGREPSEPAVQMIEDLWVCDQAEILNFARRIWSSGGEGAVFKDAESPYQRKRVGDWLKVKNAEYRSR